MENLKNLSYLFLIMIFLPFSIFAKDAAKALSISTKGDQLVFDKVSLAAKPNQPIKLTFKNMASKTSGLQHNWVLVKPGTADSVSAASIAAGLDKGWLAESSDIIVHTKLLNAGESETLTFNAPGVSGEYPYFCSFPGHNTMMKGILHIK